ncbi:MAG: endonuclease/exonuclease/phosphatase family protein [Enterobacteriaceae bacterium]|nr:endonuclease/exonuclease/phosphatase family protein [Enterobacteriaceae bacterium]
MLKGSYLRKIRAKTKRDHGQKNYAVRYVAGQPVERVFPASKQLLGEVLLPQGEPFFTDNNVFSVAIWNIHKQQRPLWQSVLASLIEKSDLILLQEAQTTPDLLKFVTDCGLVADQVPAFAIPQHPSGVMTLATSSPIYCCPLREKEPIFRFAKSSLITIYPLPGDRQLMVVNVHAINFSLGIDVYSRQLDNIGIYMNQHEGPVIFAGDFNAWSHRRFNVLAHFAHRMGLKEASFDDDHRTIAFGKPLDFVFYRELNVLSATVLTTIASDHNPLMVKFSLPE